MRFNCNGCGNEFDHRDGFPQGKEMYCRMCNKVYPKLAEFKKKIEDEFYEAKKDIIATKKLEIFGTKDSIAEREQSYMTQPKGQISEKQRENLNRSAVNEGQPGPDPLESFDPSIQNLVSEIKKKQGIRENG